MAKQRSLGPQIVGWLIVAGALAAFPVYLVMREDTINVTAAPVEQGRVEQTITAIASGTVMPSFDSLVAAGTMGTVLAVPFKEGEQVKKDDVLVELRHAEMDAQVLLAQANLKVGESRLEQARMGAVINKEVSGTRVAQAEAQFEQAKKDYERVKALKDKGAIPQDMLDKVALAMKVTQEALGAANAGEGENDVRTEEIRMAEASIEQMQAGVAVATATRENAFVRAPFDGVVAKILRDRGEAVTIGMPLLQLVDQSECYVEAPFDEANASQIKIGQKVRINLDAYRDSDFFGTVDFISPIVSINPDLSRTLNVRVRVDQGVESFISGMSADVVILVDEKENVIFAPTESLIRQEFAYVVEGGRAVRRDIKTGVGNWNTVEITDGLQKGELLITSVSLADLKEDVKVQVVDKLEP
ncbi:MAG: efflux RND transporter periplasmic adaptor subunit [Candidatus Hydrogenedentes bacterium]|nr:efflux RND transporter periplasmic adaptor subunit [Candidatus Hydrogenedentota bacterium]